MASQTAEQDLNEFADPQEDRMLRKPPNCRNFSCSFSNTGWIGCRLRNNYFPHEDHRGRTKWHYFKLDLETQFLFIPVCRALVPRSAGLEA